MKAVQYAEYGGPEVLHVADDVPEPHAGPGQIRIKVRAAGVNGIDWKIRRGSFGGGKPPAHPLGTGIDAAGVVDEIGEGVTGVAIGDPVFGSGHNTIAEYAVLSGWARMPEGVSYEEAAGYPIPAETAIRTLRQVGVQPGETLLVNGAAGGVGSALVQVARARGITVIGIAGAGNQDYLRSLGAIPTTYGDGLVDRVRSLAPEGVDAAIDVAGSGVVPDLITLTGKPSKVLSIADFGASTLGALVSTDSEDPPAAFAEVARLYTEGVLRIPVGRAFPMTEAGAAHAAAQAGHATGRWIVTIP
jgi:NADPH:quinone reductase-like Zn-dependent oxidoreductase